MGQFYSTIPIRPNSRSSERLVAVSGCRGLTRTSLWSNRATAPVAVDPGDGMVTLAGRVLAVDPVDDVPLSRRYLLR